MRIESCASADAAAAAYDGGGGRDAGGADGDLRHQTAFNAARTRQEVLPY